MEYIDRHRILYGLYILLTFGALIGEWSVKRGLGMTVVLHPDQNVLNPNFYNSTHLITVGDDGTHQMLERKGFSVLTAPFWEAVFALSVTATFVVFAYRYFYNDHRPKMVISSYIALFVCHFPFFMDDTDPNMWWMLSMCTISWIVLETYELVKKLWWLHCTADLFYGCVSPCSSASAKAAPHSTPSTTCSPTHATCTPPLISSRVPLCSST